jgi:hypothetical protein
LGLDQDGREMLTFIDDEFTQPGPWSLEGAAALGVLLRDLHQATRAFRPPADAVWFPGTAGTWQPGQGDRPPATSGYVCGHRPPKPVRHWQSALRHSR